MFGHNFFLVVLQRLKKSYASLREIFLTFAAILKNFINFKRVSDKPLLYLLLHWEPLREYFWLNSCNIERILKDVHGEPHQKLDIATALLNP